MPYNLTLHSTCSAKSLTFFAESGGDRYATRVHRPIIQAWRRRGEERRYRLR